MKYTYNDGCLNINLDEELDVNSCRELKNVIDGYIMRYSPNNFVIDLSNVKFMDSSGIGLIIGRYNLVKMLGCKMSLVNPSSTVKRIIELSNISSNIQMLEKEEI